MKSRVFTIIPFFLVFNVSCKQKTEKKDAPTTIDTVDTVDTVQDENTDNKEQKPLLETYEDSVRMTVFDAQIACDPKNDLYTFKNEEWLYCNMNGSVEYAFIETRNDNKLIKEEFIIEDDELIYAYEKEQTEYENDTIYWSCEYILKNSKVVKFSSMGLGETENPKWKPESIILQWKGHSKNYNKVKNKR